VPHAQGGWPQQHRPEYLRPERAARREQVHQKARSADLLNDRTTAAAILA
jgi:hypothetical protein